MKKITEFTEEEQTLINNVCVFENIKNIDYEYFKKNDIIQKNKVNEDIKRPSLITYEKDEVKINKKYTYLYNFPHSESGINTQTFEII
jgi:hypothetical protein